MTYALFIDDERFPPDNGRDWEIARSLPEMAGICARRGSPSFISFDHDLGDEVPSGHDIAKAMVLSDMDESPVEGLDFRFAPNFSYSVHSENPIGRANIIGYLDGYLRMKRSGN